MKSSNASLKKKRNPHSNEIEHTYRIIMYLMMKTWQLPLSQITVILGASVNQDFGFDIVFALSMSI